jgi:hypothetical protein
MLNGCASTHNTTACYCTFGFVAKTVVFISGGKRFDANQSDAGIVYKVTTTTSGSSPKITYFDAFNRKTKEQHTGFDGRKIISDIHYDDA